MPRELPRNAAAARATGQRELQRLARARVGVRVGRRSRHAEMREPSLDGGEIVVLHERIERDPQPEALREGNLLLDRFAWVHLVADVARFEVLGEVFGRQM